MSKCLVAGGIVLHESPALEMLKTHPSLNPSLKIPQVPSFHLRSTPRTSSPPSVEFWS